jgi:hypothetical protein
VNQTPITTATKIHSPKKLQKDKKKNGEKTKNVQGPKPKLKLLFFSTYSSKQRNYIKLISSIFFSSQQDLHTIISPAIFPSSFYDHV